MVFVHPWYLLLLLLVPPLVWWWSRQRSAAIKYPATSLFAGLPTGRSRFVRRATLILRTAGVVLLILALSGPRFPDIQSRVPTEGIAIQMVVDVSGSMGVPDYQWQGMPTTRLDAVKRAFELFVVGGEGPEGKKFEGRPNDLVGLVTFAKYPESLCPLTLSHDVLLSILADKKVEDDPLDMTTNISDAIVWGLLRLEKAKTRRKVLVVLSDGEHNVLSDHTPTQIAQLAANLGVMIYCIDAGGDLAQDDASRPDGGPSAAKIREQAEKAMQTVAGITGGQYFKARDTETLMNVCRQIDSLEKHAIQTFHYQNYLDAYSYLGLCSFALFLGLYLLELTVWTKAP